MSTKTSAQLTALADKMLDLVDCDPYPGTLTAVVVLVRLPEDGTDPVLIAQFRNPDQLHVPKLLHRAAQAVSQKYGQDHPVQGRPS